MHPYHHALSSQRRHGGEISDYLPLHSWFDASKTVLGHFTHRALRHHREGVAEAVRIFGETIAIADGARVPVEVLGLQHLAEDMSILPSAADWLSHIELPAALSPTMLRTPEELAAASARRFRHDAGTAPAAAPLVPRDRGMVPGYAPSRHASPQLRHLRGGSPLRRPSRQR